MYHRLTFLMITDSRNYTTINIVCATHVAELFKRRTDANANVVVVDDDNDDCFSVLFLFFVVHKITVGL